MKVVDDVGSIARAREAAEDPEGYFARGREEVRAEILRAQERPND